MKVPCTDLETNDNVILHVDEIVFMELVYVKRNTRIVIHTAQKQFYFKLSGSLEACEVLFSDFGFVRSDSCNLVNLGKISAIEKTAYLIEACFHDTSKRASCSRSGFTKLKNMMNPD